MLTATKTLRLPPVVVHRSTVLTTAARRSLATRTTETELPPCDADHGHEHKRPLTIVPTQLKAAMTTLVAESNGPAIRVASLKMADALLSTSGILDRANAPKLMSRVSPDRALRPHHVPYTDDATIMAYLTTRMPVTYAATRRALSEAIARCGIPATMLDIGTGLGTAVWALRDLESGSTGGPNGGATVTAVDVNSAMLDVAKRIAELSGPETCGSVRWDAYLPAGVNDAFDLTTLAFVLSEIEDPALRERLLKSAWDLTGGALVVVDRGTPAGFARMLEVRDAALNWDRAEIVAPCPHMKKCPLTPGPGRRDWCHFSQRLERPAEMQRTKHASTNLEDVKFTYLVIRRQQDTPGPAPTTTTLASIPAEPKAPEWPRVLAPPLKRGGHVLVDVCAADGQARRVVVTKSQGKDVYKAARRLGWGDQWPHAWKAEAPGRGVGREVAVPAPKSAKKKGDVATPKPATQFESAAPVIRLPVAPAPAPAVASAPAAPGSTAPAPAPAASTPAPTATTVPEAPVDAPKSSGVESTTATTEYPSDADADSAETQQPKESSALRRRRRRRPSEMGGFFGELLRKDEK
ncbi:mitochondrial small ribosomal subunit Rsm22-domain-containing protein [Blastocladiella britannica]|nr:mitochondrial small ribosomal subunit Rsm22-domain-containing protein [Blastocladiella britannica]